MCTETAEKSTTSFVWENRTNEATLNLKGVRIVWKFDTYLPNYKTSCPIRQLSLKSKTWEPQISPSALSFVTNLQALTRRDKTKQRIQIRGPSKNMWQARAFLCWPREKNDAHSAHSHVVILHACTSLTNAFDPISLLTHLVEKLFLIKRLMQLQINKLWLMGFLAVATQETPFDDLELRFIVVMVQNAPEEILLLMFYE